ncbi:MAG: acetylornithine/succinylornithine family transaminase [Verrucomicrobiota bacterium]
MTTPPTGSRAQHIHADYDAYVAPTYPASPVIFDRGEGSYVWDVDGRRYLDMGGGIAVNALGHCPPEIQRALAVQSARLIHCSNHYRHELQARLARKLVDLTGPGKVFFCNSGAEANEALFKLARRHGQANGGQRYKIITTDLSFHGRTLAAIAATGQESIRAGFGPAMPGFTYVPFNDLEAARGAVDGETAAIMIEGIQGESGILPASADYLLGLRRLCDEHGILLLVDAVQCGMFRTGRFMSYQRVLEGVEGGEDFAPDAVSMAKSLGGGFPIGAAWFGEKVAGTLGPGTHGTTFGGTPLACAVALAVIEAIEEKQLETHIREVGDLMAAELEKLAARDNHLQSVHGFGGMLGLQLDDRVNPTEMTAKARENGLIIMPAGRGRVRLLPALNVSRWEAEEALGILAETL